MFNLFRYFLWLVVICAMALGFDQLMMSFPQTTPGLVETQKFYVDFRQRLTNLILDHKNPPATIPPTAQRSQPKLPAKTAEQADSIASVITKTAVSKVKESANRYLYVDGQGDLQFADHLEQIPKRYRDSAQALAK